MDDNTALVVLLFGFFAALVLLTYFNNRPRR